MVVTRSRLFLGLGVLALLLYLVPWFTPPPPGEAATTIWTRQFGTESIEYTDGVAADASGVYVVGWTDVREDN